MQLSPHSLNTKPPHKKSDYCEAILLWTGHMLVSTVPSEPNPAQAPGICESRSFQMILTSTLLFKSSQLEAQISRSKAKSPHYAFSQSLTYRIYEQKKE